MARGKKKRREKRELRNLTTKAMCCITNSYCNTINDLEMLDTLKQETVRLYGTGEILPSVASSIMTNLSRRIVQVKGNIAARKYISEACTGYYEIL